MSDSGCLIDKGGILLSFLRLSACCIANPPAMLTLQPPPASYRCNQTRGNRSVRLDHSVAQPL